MSQKCLIAVVGPTGSGKTAMAASIARRFNGVIVSADSRQIYRGLDAGTNKDGTPCRYHSLPARCLDGAVQLLIDIAEPGVRYTLADWLSDASSALKLIWDNGQLPIVTGGTGLYATALLEGYMPGLGRHAKRKRRVTFKNLTLMPEINRQLLYERADERVRESFDKVAEEVKMMLRSGVDQNWIEKIGLDYRLALRFCHGSVTRPQALSAAQAANRAFIRRQLTWWRHHGEVRGVTSITAAERLVAAFIRENRCNRKQKR